MWLFQKPVLASPCLLKKIKLFHHIQAFKLAKASGEGRKEGARDGWRETGKEGGGRKGRGGEGQRELAVLLSPYRSSEEPFH